MGLILTRKEGERIMVGDDIVVDVRRIKGPRVVIAIEAPPELKILRRELWEQSTEPSEGNDGDR